MSEGSLWSVVLLLLCRRHRQSTCTRPNVTFDLGTLQGFSSASAYSVACRRSSGAEEASEWLGRGGRRVVKWCSPAVAGHSAVHLQWQPHAGRRAGGVVAPGHREVSAVSRPSQILLEHAQKCSPAVLRLPLVCLLWSFRHTEDILSGRSSAVLCCTCSSAIVEKEGYRNKLTSFHISAKQSSFCHSVAVRSLLGLKIFIFHLPR